jgi:hypothetical protein
MLQRCSFLEIFGDNYLIKCDNFGEDLDIGFTLLISTHTLTTVAMNTLSVGDE